MAGYLLWRHCECGIYALLFLGAAAGFLGYKMMLVLVILLGTSFSPSSYKRPQDLVCAPRPPPPVCRVISSESEAKGSEEYGLPSSLSINTICFAGYVLYYFMGQQVKLSIIVFITALLITLVSLVIFGRLYLGMHAPIDIVAGCAIGVFLLLGWCNIDEYLDGFITGAKNGRSSAGPTNFRYGVLTNPRLFVLQFVSFWAAIAILGLFTYPTPESPTPSFGDYTAFSGVTLGVVSGVHRTFSLSYSGLPSAVSLTPLHVGMKTALGMVTIFAVKEGSMYLATLFLPLICNVLECCWNFISIPPST